MRALPGNPCGGHTLAQALEQVEILTDQRPALAVVDRGYRGHAVATTKVLISGTRRGITQAMAKPLRRRSAIEPEIGHMKTDGRQIPRRFPRRSGNDRSHHGQGTKILTGRGLHRMVTDDLANGWNRLAPKR